MDPIDIFYNHIISPTSVLDVAISPVFGEIDFDGLVKTAITTETTTYDEVPPYQPRGSAQDLPKT